MYNVDLFESKNAVFFETKINVGLALKVWMAASLLNIRDFFISNYEFGSCVLLMLIHVWFRIGYIRTYVFFPFHLLSFPFLRQSIFYIALHCTHPNLKVKKRIKIYSDSKQYPLKLCLIKYYIKLPCFLFWKLNIFICGFSTKVTCAFLASATMEKWRFRWYIGHATL